MQWDRTNCYRFATYGKDVSIPTLLLNYFVYNYSKCTFI